jgi:outer membrane protein OmpA-like peptidoglycan-associated protein
MKSISVAAACLAGFLSAAAGAQNPTLAMIPAYEKVALEANVAFDAGIAALPAAGRVQLDEFLRQMRGLDSQTIRAAGSEARVSAVKAYLVSKGIGAERVQRRSAAEAQPGSVSIEVSGTRLVQK